MVFQAGRQAHPLWPGGGTRSQSSRLGWQDPGLQGNCVPWPGRLAAPGREGRMNGLGHRAGAGRAPWPRLRQAVHSQFGGGPSPLEPFVAAPSSFPLQPFHSQPRQETSGSPFLPWQVRGTEALFRGALGGHPRGGGRRDARKPTCGKGGLAAARHPSDFSHVLALSGPRCSHPCSGARWLCSPGALGWAERRTRVG